MIGMKIALRNVLRNRRRSVMTTSTIALGTCAVLLLGALMTYIVLDFQTSTVRRTGHLVLFKEGYFQYGAGNPVSYGISHYRDVITTIEKDPVLAERLQVITPMQVVFGIAGNPDANTSKTFFGQGIIPADRARMRRWSGYELPQYALGKAKPISDEDDGVVGFGLGRILGLCKQLNIPDCAQRQRTAEAEGRQGGKPGDQTLLDLAASERKESGAQQDVDTSNPRIDLLASTAGGAPNVVSLRIVRAEFQGIKDLDDNFVLMQLPVAQQLLYGRGEHKVTGILLQLRHTDDIPAVRQRLAELLKSRNLGLEVRDFAELTPLYKQALNFFSFIFTFVALVIGVIVVFTVMNTMSMSVLERTSEIGTSRALGVQRASIGRQFVLEGALLGAFGATAGVTLAGLIVFVINHAGIVWTPPTTAGAIPLRLYLLGNPLLLAGTWLALVTVAAVAAVFPAYRASRMPVVDALRHV